MKHDKMEVLVCIRQGLDGEINPFDASAYEAALRIPNANVTLLSMGPQSTKDLLLRLTRLGAKKAILLSDPLFAGSDTLATAYTLSLAAKELHPDLVLCGRQTLVGDTGQTGPMLSVMMEYSIITNVMSIDTLENGITCTTRDSGIIHKDFPALLTVERIHTLRLPSILSKMGEVVVLSAADLNADPSKCGWNGSPTRVLQTFENQSGKRKCKFFQPSEIFRAIEEGKSKVREKIPAHFSCSKRLKNVVIVGESPRSFAESVSDDIHVLPLTTSEDLACQIKALQPSAVLWGSDSRAKTLAAQVSAMLGLGLCADCTALETDGDKLIMYRPALSGSIIAKIESLTFPAMATVRTNSKSDDVIVAAGWGVKDCVDEIKAFADKIGGELASSRKMVDQGVLPYSLQVGLTGKTVAPPVYIAIGISGAVHHIAGMQQAGTVIAVNPDQNAPIFEYADYGILCEAQKLFQLI